MDLDAPDVVITAGTGWSGARPALAALLYAGYAQKAAALRVEEETAVTILAEALRLDRCLVAAAGGVPVGVVGLVEGHARPLEFPFALVRRHFGLWRSIGYSLLLRVRDFSRPAAGELVFEALAVAPSARSRGIGRRLVEQVECYARANGYGTVGLDVTDTNQAAIRLYSRLGFAIVKTRRYPLAGRAGFGGNHHMRKRVQGDCRP